MGGSRCNVSHSTCGQTSVVGAVWGKTEVVILIYNVSTQISGKGLAIRGRGISSTVVRYI